jgi:hypothetical protein
MDGTFDYLIEDLVTPCGIDSLTLKLPHSDHLLLASMECRRAATL